MEHAKLGASSTKQWFNCPGSLRFIASQPDFLLDTESEAAEAGTEAHALADKCLETGTDTDNEAVQTYLDEVRSQSGTLYIEHRVKIRDDMWGTLDAAKVSDPTLTITDYKNGFVPVDPEENTQAMFYALGALREFYEWFDPEKIIIVIVQPNAQGDDVKRWETTPERIYEYEKELMERAEATRRPDAPLIAGDHCSFCDAIAVCPKYRERLVKGFSNPALGEALKFASALRSWEKSLQRVAYKNLMRGNDVPGMKLVMGRKNRIWKDEAEVERIFGGVDPKIFKPPVPRKLKSPAQVEKILKGTKIGEHIIKPDGELQVVIESDKRTAVASKAEFDFKDVEIEE